jgi:hypothetical protein
MRYRHVGDSGTISSTRAPSSALQIHGTGHVERSYELNEKTRDADLDMVMHFKPAASGLVLVIERRA